MTIVRERIVVLFSDGLTERKKKPWWPMLHVVVRWACVLMAESMGGVNLYHGIIRTYPVMGI